MHYLVSRLLYELLRANVHDVEVNSLSVSEINSTQQKTTHQLLDPHLKMAGFLKKFGVDRCLYLGILCFLIGYVVSACSFRYGTKPGERCFCTGVGGRWPRHTAVHKDKNGPIRCCGVLECPLDTEYEICAEDDPASGSCQKCLTGEFNFASWSVDGLHCQQTSNCLGKIILDPSHPCHGRTCLKDHVRIDNGSCVHKSASLERINPTISGLRLNKLSYQHTFNIQNATTSTRYVYRATTVADDSNTDSGFEWSRPMVAIVVLVIIVVFVVVSLLIVCLLLHCGPEVTRRKVDAFLHRVPDKLCCDEEAADGELSSSDPVQLPLNDDAAENMLTSTDPVSRLNGSFRGNFLDDGQLAQLQHNGAR